ncbi:MAG: RDD family protein [Mycobacterium sp.]|nr:RDD family protein [Mycobacterium sp.]
MTAEPRPAYPGAALGLPQSGPGSLAPMGRRLAALTIDWSISYGLAALGMTFGLLSPPTLATAVLVIWFVLGVVAARLFDSTPGQLALGLGVAPLDGRPPVGVVRLAVRGLLLAMVIPALFSDADGRGLHDQLTRTAVLRR